MKPTLEQHKQTAAAIQQAEEAASRLLRLRTLPLREQRRVSKGLHALG